MKATIKKIWDLIGALIVAAAVVLAAATAGMKLIGFDMYIVLSGSMEPQYPVGAVIYVNEADLDSLAPGDVITFQLAEHTIATHRIVEIRNDDGVVRYVTKGDANEHPDAETVAPEQIIGVPKFSIPMLGHLISYIRKPPGFYMAISASALMLLLVILPDIIFENTETDDPQKRNKAVKDKKR